MSRLAAFVGCALIAIAVLAGAFVTNSSSATSHSTRLSADTTPAPVTSPNDWIWGG